MTTNQINSIKADGAKNGLLRVLSDKLWQAGKFIEDAQIDQFARFPADLTKIRERLDDAAQLFREAFPERLEEGKEKKEAA
jgi:uncharacterized protein YeaO (DUF488 family)